MTNNMITKKLKIEDILNATHVNFMCTKWISCKAQKIHISQSKEICMLSKEMVFGALLCNYGRVTFTTLKFEKKDDMFQTYYIYIL